MNKQHNKKISELDLNGQIRREVRFMNDIKQMTFCQAKAYLVRLRSYQCQIAHDGDEHCWNFEEYSKYPNLDLATRISLIKEVLNQLPNFHKFDKRKYICIWRLLQTRH